MCCCGVVRGRRGWRIEGDLDDECGERLFTALAAEAHRDPHRPLDTAAWAQSRREGVDLEPDQLPFDDVAGGAAGPAALLRPRDRARRLHDALSRLLGRYLDEGLAGTHHKAPLQVNVTLSSATVEGLPGSLPPLGDSGAPLARSLVRRWWCDSRVTAYVMSRGGKALGYAHLGRTTTAAERRAALVQSGNRCAGEGCCPGRPDPMVPLRPHHVIGYAAGGRTTLEDTVMMCDALHHDVHTGRRTVRLRDGRLLREQGWVIPPTDGSPQP